MKKHEVFTLTTSSSFSGMREKLSKEVEEFLNVKVNEEGYKVISVSFSYYGQNGVTTELVAFITLSK